MNFTLFYFWVWLSITVFPESLPQCKHKIRFWLIFSIGIEHIGLRKLDSMYRLYIKKPRDNIFDIGTYIKNSPRLSLG